MYHLSDTMDIVHVNMKSAKLDLESVIIYIYN